MFGGEFFDNAADQIHTFNDLFRFSCSKQQWTNLVVPNGCGTLLPGVADAILC